MPIFKVEVVNALLARGYGSELLYIRRNYTEEGKFVFMFTEKVSKELVGEIVESLREAHSRSLSTTSLNRSLSTTSLNRNQG